MSKLLAYIYTTLGWVNSHVADIKITEDLTYFYRKNIQPQEPAFEQLRVKHLKSLHCRVIVFACTLILFIYTFFSNILIHGDIIGELFTRAIILYVAYIFFTILASWTSSPIRFYKEKVNEKIFPIIYDLWNCTFNLNSALVVRKEVDGAIVQDMYKEQIVQSRMRAETNTDKVFISYDDVRIDIFHSILYDDDNPRNSPNQVFNGLFVCLDFNYKFKDLEKFYCHIIISKISEDSYNPFKPSKDLVLFYIKDNNSKEILKVYSDDLHKAKKLLLPSFVKALLELNKLFGDKDLEAGFINNKLSIKIHCRDQGLEPQSIFAPCNFVNELKNISQKINAIFSLVNEINNIAAATTTSGN